MSVFRMPSLGADMDAGTLAEWTKKPGEPIKRGDIVAVVETQKGAIEIEAFEDGAFTKLLIEPGTKVPVGTPIAEMRGPKESAPVVSSQAVQPPIPAAIQTPPRRARAATQPASREPAAAALAGPKASPAARQLAKEKGIDLAAIEGTGPGGAIVFVDVERATQSAKAIRSGETPSAKSGAAGPPDRSAMRRAIAAAMSRAKREIPHYYLRHDIDVTATIARLAELNARRAPDARLLLGALYLKAVAAAAKAMPEFNGFYADNAYQPATGVHAGMAIALRGGGLVAPAIHNTDQLSLDDVMAKLRDLVARVRAGRMRQSELNDPTITVSSLGERGVDALYGVIYPPQVALIGFGSPRRRPAVIGDQVAVRSIVTATLAADHRVSDGHRGALFLGRIAAQLENPEA